MDIYLSAAARNNLQSLQNTSMLTSRTSERLATGLEVNSALDNPNAFFTSKSLEGRASDLSTLLQDQGQAISTIKAADQALEAIGTLLETAKAKANAALSATTLSERDDLAAEFNTLMEQVEGIAEDAGYKGVNLLGGDSLTSVFNEERNNTLTTTGVDYTDATAVAPGLAVPDTVAGNGAGAWAEGTPGVFPASDTLSGDATITASLQAVQSALESVRSTASSFATSFAIIDNRMNFTQDQVDTLNEGSSKLILADTNEESANLLALQTRQSLGTTALSLTSQAEQGVLRLF